MALATPMSAERQKLFDSACLGDIPAIIQLGTMARATLALADVLQITRVFVRNLTREVDNFGTSKIPRIRADPVEPSTHAALDYVDRICAHTPLPEDPRVFDVLSAEIMGSWSPFWAWIRHAIDDCLLSVAQHGDLVLWIDEVFSTVVAHRDHTSRIQLPRDVLNTFTRLWLHDTERKQTTISLPTILFKDYFSEQQFADAVGGTPSELAMICLDHLELGHSLLLFQTKICDDLYTAAMLLRGLQSQVAGVLLSSMQHGLIPRVMAIARDIVPQADRISGCNWDLNFNEIVSMIGTLIASIVIGLPLGALYAIEAIDSGFIPLVLFTSRFWNRRDVLRSRVLQSLGSTIESGLSILQEYTFHIRVLWHVRKAERRWMAEYRTLIPDSCTFKKAWETLNEQISFVSRVRRAYIKDSIRPHLCANKGCPKKSKAIQGRERLRECTRCHELIVCSDACFRSVWPRHRQYCNAQVASSDRPLRTARMLTMDVISFFEGVTALSSGFVANEAKRLYSRSASRLHCSGKRPRPTHFLRIDVQSEPMAASIESMDTVPQGSSMHVQHNLDQCWKLAMTFPTCIIVCVQFRLGLYTFAAWSLMDPKLIAPGRFTRDQ